MLTHLQRKAAACVMCVRCRRTERVLWRPETWAVFVPHHQKIMRVLLKPSSCLLVCEPSPRLPAVSALRVDYVDFITRWCKKHILVPVSQHNSAHVCEDHFHLKMWAAVDLYRYEDVCLFPHCLMSSELYCVWAPPAVDLDANLCGRFVNNDWTCK